MADALVGEERRAERAVRLRGVHDGGNPRGEVGLQVLDGEDAVDGEPRRGSAARQGERREQSMSGIERRQGRSALGGGCEREAVDGRDQLRGRRPQACGVALVVSLSLRQRGERDERDLRRVVEGEPRLDPLPGSACPGDAVRAHRVPGSERVVVPTPQCGEQFQRSAPRLRSTLVEAPELRRSGGERLRSPVAHRARRRRTREQQGKQQGRADAHDRTSSERS